ncbi:MAG: DUF11 domain-containing protein [Methanobrevibacter sp.]|uniref:DUF11 domain-containing protein n=1 Tax=Methanobrevibacter sp. TaxID=66852 RepID=UPI0025E97E76|nr:DUF11 domain-containing protein [Methanobrevibacter sp.]MBR0271001.1 DUF11 domain-containing protein [Methanobrevibacter sp.]
MNSKVLLLSFVFILFGLSVMGGVCAIDNSTTLGDNNIQPDTSNLEFTQNYTPTNINKNQVFEVLLNVKNTCPDTLHNLTILYKLPDQLNLIIWPDEYINNSIWSIDTLYPNEDKTLTLVCIPTASNHTYEFTTDTGLEMDVHTNPLADLAVGVDYIVGDDVITWIVNVINNGPDYAVNTVVSNLPTQLGVISSNLTKGFLLSNQWIIGDLASGEAQSLTLITNFVDGFEYNISVLSDTYDDNMSNNYASGIVKNKSVPVYNEILDSNATANPILLLMLAVVFVPFLRFKKD